MRREEIPPRNPNDRNRQNYQPKFEIKSSEPVADVLPVLMRVASRAFRRPVTSGQVQAYVDLFAAQRSGTTEEALRAAVTAVFCSPEFLYLRESAGTLDDFALASRLAYFLTRSAPDDELLAMAAAGTLTKDRAALLAQANRLLNHPHAERFVTDFAAFNDFLTKLKGLEENGRSLLDHTAVLFGSNLGNASSHDAHNIPILVAGGGYKHGQHLAHDQKHNTPFSNLLVSIAQHMGVEIDKFGTSTAAGIREFETT